jgi:Flp pilus assembly protein TadG
MAVARLGSRDQRLAGAGRRGAVAVEAAVALPVLLALLTAIWDVGRLVQVRQLVDNAAREAGRQASTGLKDVASIQADVRRYLQRSGVKRTTGTTITIANLTSTEETDPTAARQLDHYRITVSLPVSNVRLIVLKPLTDTSTIRATSDWYSMKDLPVVISGTIPIE